MSRTTGIASLILACLAFGLCPAPARASDADVQVWTTFSLATRLGERARLAIDVSPRFRDERAGSDQLQLRFSLDRDLFGKLSVGAGVTHLRSPGQREVRLHQQITARAGSFSSRTRLEERLVDGADRTGVRLRERIQFKTSIDSRHTLFVDGEAIFVLQNQSMAGRTGFDNARAGITLQRPLIADVDLGLGYLFSLTPRRNMPDRHSHALQLMLIWRP